MVGEVGADPTTLVRGTVLQTVEFADSLYSPVVAWQRFFLKRVIFSVANYSSLSYPYCIIL